FRDGRPATALLLADRALLGGVGIRRLSRHARRLAGGVTAGVAFAVPQFLVSNFHGPWLVDIVAAICSMIAVGVLLKFWQPKGNWEGQHVAVPEIRDGDTQSLPETRGSAVARSEERRVGKECRSRGSPYH